MRVLIVDGHSVIFAWPDMRKLHTRRTSLAREAVVKQLREYADYSGVHVVVVFDGRGVKAADESEPHGIQVFYSGVDQTADEIIERLTGVYGKKHDITVATDDLLEQQTVGAFGATAISTEGLRALLDVSARDFSRDLARHRRKV